ncbi:glycosyltransferase family 2 protein [Photobacterium piscicola]|uniref:glycosyltransferase family 2 protein n=1 Tax=Photobacterium piscicola TaxID=1378299 RepID=UPI002E184AEA|nr:glycosyltransferase family 2 protein [Photobacterium piscicola]
MLVTIGIPVYNAENFIWSSINSILNQTYTNFELIIIDDGSTDRSLSIIKSFNDKRIRIFHDGENKKLPARLNQIIELAQGDYIMRMDADDIASEDRLEILLKYLEQNKNKDVVFSRICSIKNNGVINGVHGIIRDRNLEITDLVKGNTGFPHASLLARKEWCLRNLYNQENRLSEDFELYLTAFLKGDFKASIIPNILYFYREEMNVKYDRVSVAYKSQIKVLDRFKVTNKNEIKIFTKAIYVFKLKLFISYIIHVLKLENVVINMRGGNINNKEMNELSIRISTLMKGSSDEQ